MTMSIVHRATGIALYGGTLVLLLWVLAAAIGGGFFDGVNWLFGSWFGQLVLFGYTWVLFHHMLGGIRHRVWDTGHGFGPEAREAFAKFTLAGSIVLTILVWIVGYVVR